MFGLNAAFLGQVPLMGQGQLTKDDCIWAYLEMSEAQKGIAKTQGEIQKSGMTNRRYDEMKYNSDKWNKARKTADECIRSGLFKTIQPPPAERTYIPPSPPVVTPPGRQYSQAKPPATGQFATTSYSVRDRSLLPETPPPATPTAARRRMLTREEIMKIALAPSAGASPTSPVTLVTPVTSSGFAVMGAPYPIVNL